MEIFVIRHTRVTGAEGLCYGRSDPPLADSFEREMLELAARLPGRFDAIYSSPSPRCRRLAEALLSLLQPISPPARGIAQSSGPSPALPLYLSEDLLEMDFGAWEGRPWDAIPRAELDAWGADFVHVKPEGGENLEMLFRRVQRFLSALRARPEGRVLVITHAGVIRCIGAAFRNLPLQDLFTFEVGYGEVFRFHPD